VTCDKDRFLTEHWGLWCMTVKLIKMVQYMTRFFEYTDIIDYWVSISKDKSNLGIFQIFIYTRLYTCLVLLLCSCAFTFESNVTWCKQKMHTCVTFTWWELKFWRSHFWNAKLKCEIKCDRMCQLLISLMIRVEKLNWCTEDLLNFPSLHLVCVLAFRTDVL